MQFANNLLFVEFEGGRSGVLNFRTPDISQTDSGATRVVSSKNTLKKSIHSHRRCFDTAFTGIPQTTRFLSRPTQRPATYLI